jgi:hypothetical protein
VPCPHTGEAICDALYKCLQSWNIDCRVSTVTLDNCSSNDTMIGLMESKIGPGNLLLDGDVLHMRCMGLFGNCLCLKLLLVVHQSFVIL